MELRQIQYFMQLYKDRNITKASKNLFISQQGLSKSIGKLEEELEFPLFSRSATGVVPTDEANLLYRHFDKITSSYHELLVAIDELTRKRTLTIVAPHGFALSCEKNFFSQYGVRNPELNIKYGEDFNWSIPYHLMNQKADVAIMSAPIPRDLTSHLVCSKEPVYAVMDRSNPLAKKYVITEHDLNEQSLLLLDVMNEINTSILKEANAAGITYSIYNTTTINVFLSMISESPLIGFSTKRMYRYYNFPEIIFLPLTTGNGNTYFIENHFVTVKGKNPDKEVQRLIDFELELHKRKDVTL